VSNAANFILTNHKDETSQRFLDPKLSALLASNTVGRNPDGFGTSASWA
jgi:hypothetical protein